MEVLLNMFPRKNQRKDHSLQLKLPSFRKSSEAPSGSRSEVNTEARRKAAAWAWHQRAGGDVAPTERGVGGTAAVSRKSMVYRPESRFKAESTRETACDMSSKSKSSSGTSLFHASEISSLARQISLFAQKSREESSPKKSSVHQRVFDLSSTADLSSFRESRQHASEWEFALDPRSFSARLAPRQFPHQTAAKLETQREYFDSDSITQTDRFAQFSPSDFRNGAVPKEKRSSLKKSFFLFQKIFRRSARENVNSSDSDRNEQVRSHHHIHHHHHFFYHPTPDEEFGILESPKARRHSESFTSYTEPGAEDHETRQNSRHSEDFALKYRAHIGDGAGAARRAAEVERYYYRCSPDEQHSSPANYTEARPSRRYSENFSADKARGSPRMRRHSADIAASHRTDFGAAERGAALVRVWE